MSTYAVRIACTRLKILHLKFPISKFGVHFTLLEVETVYWPNAECLLHWTWIPCGACCFGVLPKPWKVVDTWKEQRIMGKEGRLRIQVWVTFHEMQIHYATILRTFPQSDGSLVQWRWKCVEGLDLRGFLCPEASRYEMLVGLELNYQCDIDLEV